MNYRKFGNTDISVSEIGLGCASLAGDLFTKSHREAIRILHSCFDAGINFYDTADIYQFGKSEQLIGDVFHGERRDKVFIATKGGEIFSRFGKLAMGVKPLLKPIAPLLSPWRNALVRLKDHQKSVDHSRKHLRDAVHNSLQRLQTDYIDLYQMHIPNVAMLRRGEFVHTLEDLRQEGKIRYFGVSCSTTEEAEICLKIPGITALQLDVSLLAQRYVSRILPSCQRAGIAAIAKAPLMKGLLTDAPDLSVVARHIKNPDLAAQLKAKADALRFLANSKRTFAQAALRFVLQQQGVCVVIPGITTQDMLEENLATLSVSALTEDELAQARSIVLPGQIDNAQ